MSETLRERGARGYKKRAIQRVEDDEIGYIPIEETESRLVPVRSSARGPRAPRKVLTGMISKAQIEQQRLNRKPTLNKSNGQLRMATSGESGESKVKFQVVLGNNKGGDIFKSKANAAKYMSQNMPYYGSASMSRVRQTVDGEGNPKTVQAIKRVNTGPKKVTPYAQYTSQQWKAHPEWKQQYKGDLGGASTQIAASWSTYKTQNGIVTASKKVAAGTKLAWPLYAKMNGGFKMASAGWRSMTDPQRLQWYQANQGYVAPPKAKGKKK